MIERVILGLAVLVALAANSATPAAARSPRVIDDNDTVSLRGNVHPHARPESDVGASDPSLPMERMVLSLRLSAEKEEALERLLSQQQDRNSPNYQRWLAPEQFAERFGPKPEDVAALTGWLTAHGFTVDQVSRGRTSINFSGPVSKVERAFRTSIRKYLVDGKLRHANSRDPEIPRGLADLVAGIVSLHNFPSAAMNSGIRSSAQGEGGLQPNATFGTDHYLSPADFATIYNLNPLYASGIDGTGQTIAIVGRANPPNSSSNWASFRSSMGLPPNAPQVIVNGADPGDQGMNENGEADLDVEWSGAVAKNATIKFVTTKSTYATDGVDLSAQYIVDNNLAPVMSTSFGLCEQHMGTAKNAFYRDLWQRAAAQGITSFVSSGDSGASDCSAATAGSGSEFGLGVNGLASTPYNVAVGGTQFSDGAGGYWNAINGIGFSSAVGYIPETAWNESGAVSAGAGLWATGGGASLNYLKPSWQTAPGVPADGKRDLPDVSLSAAGHVGYLVRTAGDFYAMNGTSASSPAFAGLMALVVQKTGVRQGNANNRFYQMGQAQYASGGAAVFHDTTSGNNSVPGVAGYACGTGYDLATGLGSVNAQLLVNNWGPPADPLAIGSVNALPNGTLGVGYSTTFSASGGVPPYSWSSSGSMVPGLAINSASGVLGGTPTKAGVFSFTIQATDAFGTSYGKTFSQATSAAVCANWPVRLAGAATALFPDFTAAYALAAEGDLIQLQALDQSADFVADRGVGVSLTGGYDCGFTGGAAATGMLGRLRVAGGTVKIEGLRFK